MKEDLGSRVPRPPKKLDALVQELCPLLLSATEQYLITSANSYLSLQRNLHPCPEYWAARPLIGSFIECMIQQGGTGGVTESYPACRQTFCVAGLTEHVLSS